MLESGLEPFDYVVFGGTGDLSQRKLLPALYRRDLDQALPAAARIIAVARPERTPESFIAWVEEALNRFVGGPLDPAAWARFAGRLHYVALDATAETGWADLAALLDQAPERIRAFYLATAPSLFGTICQHLGRAGLASAQARVVLEKPIGHDLASAQAINQAVAAVFSEGQIFRIDHYLGKETVQNLMALRFANSLFEPLWSAHWIDHVQITVAETIGTEGRSGYYDRSGALRDMVQNHLLQLLCLITMEPPRIIDKDAIRDEKLKVLRSLAPIGPDQIASHTVRGQYRSGAVEGRAVRGYLKEDGVAPDSLTETFVALKLGINTWRWAGVPFYLRTGKRLPERLSEVVVQFRPVPLDIFPPGAGLINPNRLVVRLQPDESIRLHLMAKRPGPGGIQLQPAALNLSFAETFKQRMPDAYERLLMDVVRANSTLFMRRDEIEAAWSWTDGILDAWRERGDRPSAYTAGTWGPSAAIALIERDGRTWMEGSEVD